MASSLKTWNVEAAVNFFPKNIWKLAWIFDISHFLIPEENLALMKLLPLTACLNLPLTRELTPSKKIREGSRLLSAARLLDRTFSPLNSKWVKKAQKCLRSCKATGLINSSRDWAWYKMKKVKLHRKCKVSLTSSKYSHELVGTSQRYFRSDTKWRALLTSAVKLVERFAMKRTSYWDVQKVS